MKKTLFLLAKCLDSCCWLLHWLPGYRCGLSNLSFKIDRRFKLGLWKDVPHP